MSTRILLLASSSPRRRDLLTDAGIGFRVVSPEVEECHRPHETPAQYVARNAVEKADGVCDRGGLEDVCGVLAADTVVVQDGHILEKPRDAGEAAAMLRRLSGRPHHVLTGVVLYRIVDGRVTDRRRLVETTAVQFRTLTEPEIAVYVATGEPMDKAGAYAIQGLGGALVEGIDGSYSNVVGLPVEAVAAILVEWGDAVSGST